MRVVTLSYYSIRCHGAQAREKGKAFLYFICELNLDAKMLSDGEAWLKKCGGPAWTIRVWGLIIKCSQASEDHFNRLHRPVLGRLFKPGQFLPATTHRIPHVILAANIWPVVPRLEGAAESPGMLLKRQLSRLHPPECLISRSEVGQESLQV